MTSRIYPPQVSTTIPAERQPQQDAPILDFWRWWTNMEEAERREQFQSVVRQMNDVTEDNDDLVERIARAEAALMQAREAMQRLSAAIDTCHYCGADLIPERGAPHCEDCPSGCEAHDAPDCPQISDLIEAVRAALRHHSAKGENMSQTQQDGAWWVRKGFEEPPTEHDINILQDGIAFWQKKFDGAEAALTQTREALEAIPSHEAWDGPQCICDENAPGTYGYKHHWSWCKSRRAALAATPQKEAR